MRAGRLLALLLVSLPGFAPLALGESLPLRLSDWLLQQPVSDGDYPLGLSWRVRDEEPPQHALRLELMNRLSGADPNLTASPAASLRLRNWIGTLPITGRVPVAMADARWLQANPARDPMLGPGHTLAMPRRPGTVTVITEEGERCTVNHLPGQEAIAYLKACSPQGAARADWAWLAQPDARVQRFGVASWNSETQDEPAPGAWIWGPPRDGGWPDKVSEQLARFLATQGPAPDSGGASSPRAPIETERSRSSVVTAGDWGGVGLLQTPTARMRDLGQFAFHFSRVWPYTRGNIFAQPFDWLEFGFRYSDIGNRLYGPESFSGTQTYKDKSVDAKFRLLSESAYVPEIAVGLRDVAGTGLFAGEYLVANKRTGTLDWSLGLGWGYVGGRGNLRNPLGRLLSSFDTRKVDVGQGGSFGFGSYFRGPTSLFGGVQYQTPWEPLTLKLEYDGNNYQREPLSNNQRQSSPWNFGAVYRLGRAVDLTAGIERGNTLMFGLTLRTPLDAISMPKIFDPPRVAVAAARPAMPADWAETSREILRQTEWHVRRIEQIGRELRVTVDDPGMIFYWKERIERVTAVLHRDAPAVVDRFVLAYRQQGIAVTEHVIDRDAWVAARTRALPPRAQREVVIARAAGQVAGNRVERGNAPSERPLYEKSLPRFESGFGLNFQQSLGGPDGFVLFQVSAAEQAKWRIRDDTWLQGTLRYRLLDNYDKFRNTGPSDLPRVRTLVREYVTTSPLTMPNLQLTHAGRLGANQYYSVYGGYLEEMFGGVGAEWLYRPFASRIALGVDVNAVRQRDFRQGFDFRDYKVATGHATLYWDTGWQDVIAQLSAGRFLAKDTGVSVDLSRVFRNGVTIGAYFSKTNVSAAQFGEGSFDKSIYLSIPFDAFLTRSSNTVGNFVWKPLTRDGGARLGHDSLYNLTSSRRDRSLRFEPAPRPDEDTIPADRRGGWRPEPTGPEAHTRVTPKPAAGRWAQDPAHEERLIEVLYRQGFRNTRVEFDGSYRLSLTLSNDRIRPVSRAVGRAARTALGLAPLEAREIRVTFEERDAPVVIYEFVDLARLERYFGGALGKGEIADYVAVRYVDPAARETDPLARLDDLDPGDDSRKLADLLPDARVPLRVADDVAGAARLAAGAEWPGWLQAGAYGAGMVLASSVVDRRAFRFAKDHAADNWLKGGVRVGNALPWLGLAGSALVALDGSDPARSRTGYAAAEAGVSALLAATGLKYVIGRARPEEELGNRKFSPGSSEARYNAFPSRHASVAWAVATPFALEYDAPWLYGLAAATNLARIGSREHWVSDTVAGGLIGYGLGRLFWASSRAPAKGAPRVMLDRSGVKLAWEME